MATQKQRITFYAEPSVCDWLQKQPNVTYVINEICKKAMMIDNGIDREKQLIDSIYNLQKRVEALETHVYWFPGGPAVPATISETSAPSAKEG